MMSVARTTGRLLEVRTTAPLSDAEVDAFVKRFATLLTEVKGLLAVGCDLRGSPVLDGPTAARMMDLLRRDNPRIERSALLVGSERPTLWLQVERMVRESNNPNRRAFRDPAEAEAFLAPVLDDAEKRRLTAFLGAG